MFLECRFDISKVFAKLFSKSVPATKSPMLTQRDDEGHRPLQHEQKMKALGRVITKNLVYDTRDEVADVNCGAIHESTMHFTARKKITKNIDKLISLWYYVID